MIRVIVHRQDDPPVVSANLRRIIMWALLIELALLGVVLGVWWAMDEAINMK
jgi:hypothetical protein